MNLKLIWLSLLVLCRPSFGQSCIDYLSKRPKIPFVQAGISNFPLRRQSEEMGVMAMLKGRPALARRCTWCPSLTDTQAAWQWMSDSPLGQRTQLAAMSLAYLSKKNLADHFYGLSIRDGQLYFISKIPEGFSLSQAVANAGPLISNRGGVMMLRPNLTIRPDHVQSLLRVAKELDKDEAPYPFRYITLVKGHEPLAVVANQLLNAVEWSLTRDGQMNVSFYRLDKIFDLDGKTLHPFISDGLPKETLGYRRLILATMMILNENPNEAWVKILKGGAVDFFSLPEFVRGLQSEDWSDPLLQKLKFVVRDWALTPMDKLIGEYDPDRFPAEVEFNFASEQLLIEHFAKHGKEFNAASPEQYLATARRFLGGVKVAAQLGLTSDNSKIEYRRVGIEPSEFVVLDSQAKIVAVVTGMGILRTFFMQSRASTGMDIEGYLVDQAKKQFLPAAAAVGK